MKQNPHKRKLIQAIEKTGCVVKSISVRADTLLSVKFGLPNNGKVITVLFRIIPWEKDSGNTALVSNSHRAEGRDLLRTGQEYRLAFLEKDIITFISPYKLPKDIPMFRVATNDWVWMSLVDLEDYGTIISIKE